MKKMILLLCAALTLSLSGCTNAQKKYSMTATDLGFDTVVSFIAYTDNEATFNTYKEIVQQDFKYYDHLFDKYNNYENVNNIKTINDNAGIKPVKVDQVVIDFLTLNKTYSSLTNNQFDITMGSVLNIWHDVREEGMLANKNGEPSQIPDMNQLQSAKEHTGWQHIQIDKEKSSVYIDDKDVSLDVGGSAKGYAVEKIAKKLEKKGCKNAILNGGGNIRLIGNKPDSDGWSVGVQIPNLDEYATDSLVSVIIDESMSFVTSGDYQRYYMYGDEIMHHIIDPTTLMPARHCRSVTIITEDSGIADILSTTLYTISHEDGVKLLKELKNQHGIEVDAIWVYDDEYQNKEDSTETLKVDKYQLIITDGLKDKIKK